MAESAVWEASRHITCPGWHRHVEADERINWGGGNQAYNSTLGWRKSPLSRLRQYMYHRVKGSCGNHRKWITLSHDKTGSPLVNGEPVTLRHPPYSSPIPVVSVLPIPNPPFLLLSSSNPGRHVSISPLLRRGVRRGYLTRGCKCGAASTLGHAS